MTEKTENLREILTALAVKGTENRRQVVTDFLDSAGIGYELKTYDGYYDESPVNIEVDLTDYCSDRTRKLIVLTAHYDAVVGSTGANDNGSSVSVLLQIANHIKQNGSLYPVRIVFFDQEEMGARGSKAYFSDCMTEEALFINFDVIGYGDRIVFCDDSDGDPFVCEKLTSDMNMSEYGVVLCDSLPFCDANIIRGNGYPVLGISVFPEADTENMPAYYGTTIMASMHNFPLDSIDCINYDIMENVRDMLIRALSR